MIRFYSTPFVGKKHEEDVVAFPITAYWVFSSPPLIREGRGAITNCFLGLYTKAYKAPINELNQWGGARVNMAGFSKTITIKRSSKKLDWMQAVIPKGINDKNGLRRFFQNWPYDPNRPVMFPNPPFQYIRQHHFLFNLPRFQLKPECKMTSRELDSYVHWNIAISMTLDALTERLRETLKTKLQSIMESQKFAGMDNLEYARQCIGQHKEHEWMEQKRIERKASRLHTMRASMVKDDEAKPWEVFFTPDFRVAMPQCRSRCSR